MKSSVTLHEVCEELNINRTYLSNYINENFNVNFNTWINIMRIKEAQRIICLHPHLPLSQVGQKVGFMDTAHFSKQFKFRIGVTPSYWRKEKLLNKSKAEKNNF